MEQDFVEENFMNLMHLHFHEHTYREAEIEKGGNAIRVKQLGCYILLSVRNGYEQRYSEEICLEADKIAELIEYLKLAQEFAQKC